MLENSDIEGTEQTESTEADTGLTSDSSEGDHSPAETLEAPATPLTPFAQGKEKFKINGEEHEWDWETTKKYAQLGRSGQLAMVKAAQTEQKAKNAYQQILRAAESDPEGLLEVLNPKYKRGQSSSQKDGSQEPIDPRDLRIRQLEEKVSRYDSHLESQEVEQARKEIDSELEASAKKFPILNDEVYREYVKNQYRRYLNQGIHDISIEDIAFSVHQRNLENQKARDAQRKASLDQKRKNAPAHSVGGSFESSGKRENETGLEYAKRLAGRTN